MNNSNCISKCMDYPCMACPRECGADRTSGTGFCGGGALPKIARAALHFWEEPCISGVNGSGTVFFSGCNLRCPFCHNASLVLTPREGENREEEVLSYLAGRKGILEGVCITGGEPLLQPDLSDFVKQGKNIDCRRQ